MSMLESPIHLPFVPTSTLRVALVLCAAAGLAGCKGKTGHGAAPAAAQARVRVKVPKAGCEIAIPANMTIAEPSSGGFWIAEKGKNPMFDGTLISITPVGPRKSWTPPGATDVKTLKDKTNPDGSVEREGSYKTKVQTLYTAEYDYPLGQRWLYCKIAAASPKKRDATAKLCRGLAPKAL